MAHHVRGQKPRNARPTPCPLLPWFSSPPRPHLSSLHNHMPPSERLDIRGCLLHSLSEYLSSSRTARMPRVWFTRSLLLVGAVTALGGCAKDRPASPDIEPADNAAIEPTADD